MLRKGKATEYGTSIEIIIKNLMDKFISKHRVAFRLQQIDLSRAKIIEMAVLHFLDTRGELEGLLSEVGVKDQDIPIIREHLKLAMKTNAS